MLADIGKRALESLGYRVIACTDSLEALEIFKKDPEAFDAVITDYTMPKLNGIELAKAILSTRPRTHVILCTGCTDDINQRAHAIGIKEFFHIIPGKGVGAFSIMFHADAVIPDQPGAGGDPEKTVPVLNRVADFASDMVHMFKPYFIYRG